MDARVAIVTGGTFGIGAAISVDLARRGWRVVAFGLDAPQLSSVAQDGSRTLRTELRAQGLEADVMEADVSKATDVQRIVDHAMGRYARIDALVNNAAIGPLGGVLQTAEDVWDRVIDVNLKGAYLCCKAALPRLRAAGRGTIVNVSSVYGVMGRTGMGQYDTTKAAVLGFTRALAVEEAPHRIRVNAVAPAVVKTKFAQALYEGREEEVVRSYPAGRLGVPEDVAGTVAFLLSEQASWITGQTVVLDGGATLVGGVG